MNLWMKAVLSLAVVGVSLYIILTRPADEAARQWAVGTISFALGYWLKEGKAEPGARSGTAIKRSPRLLREEALLAERRERSKTYNAPND